MSYKVCSICKKELEITEFHKDKSRKGGLRKDCKECTKSRNNLRYQKKKEIVKSKIKEYYDEGGGKEKEKERNSILQEKLFSIMGNCCKICGTEEHLVIDHIDGGGNLDRKKTSKWGLIRKILSSKVDIKKYRLLCSNCNIKSHFINNVVKIETKEKTGILKECKTCLENKDTSLFHSHKKYEDGLYYECKTCDRNRGQNIKKKVMDFIGNGICAKCGESDIDKLSIDHVTPVGKKREAHGSILYRRLLRKKEKLENLQVLCFNCNLEKSDKKPVEFIEFEFIECQFRYIDKESSSSFLDNYHYDGYGRHQKFSIGVFFEDELICVAKFCPVVRQNVSSKTGFTDSEVLELDRFCIHPKRHKYNFGSFSMSKIMKMIKNDFKDIGCLVSFSDKEQGHNGSLYRSSNWKFIGETEKSYFYEKDGEIIKKKVFYDRAKSSGLMDNKTEREVAIENGYNIIKTDKKLKFMYKL